MTELERACGPRAGGGLAGGAGRRARGSSPHAGGRRSCPSSPSLPSRSSLRSPCRSRAARSSASSTSAASPSSAWTRSRRPRSGRSLPGSARRRATPAPRGPSGRSFLPPAHGPLYESDGIVSTLLASGRCCSPSSARPSPEEVRDVAGRVGRVEPGVQGFWISGAPHVVFFPGASPRLAGNVLVWVAARSPSGSRALGLDRRRGGPAARDDQRNRVRLTGVGAACVPHSSSCSHSSHPGCVGGGPWLGTASNGVAGYTASRPRYDDPRRRQAHTLTARRKWGIPRVTLNNGVGGLSADGRRSSSRRTASRTRTACSADRARSPCSARSRSGSHDREAARRLRLRRALAARPHALPDPARLEENLFQYRVRAYDLRTAKLLARVVADKRQRDWIDERLPGRAGRSSAERSLGLHALLEPEQLPVRPCARHRATNRGLHRHPVELDGRPAGDQPGDPRASRAAS